jgi:Domain of unknown function (DUF6457)
LTYDAAVAEPYARITDEFSARHGVRPLGEEEAAALLDLARLVAHGSDDRRAAPLTCYLAGVLLAAEDDPDARLRRIAAIRADYSSAMNG